MTGVTARLWGGMAAVWCAAAQTDAVRLAAPRPAYRVISGSEALFNFLVRRALSGPVEISVLDAQGALVRNLAAVQATDARIGLNRVAWDLRYEPPELVALRTTPKENPYIWNEPRFQGMATRPVLHRGIEQAQLGPLAAPGTYTVRLRAEAREYSQKFEILKTPDSHGSDADLQASVRLQLKVRDDISVVAGMTNQIERLRKQLEDQQTTQQKAQGGAEAAFLQVLQAMEEMDEKLQAVERQLISRSDALSDDKYYVEAAKLYLNLLWLNGSVGTGTGKFAGSGDYAQTETAIGLVYNMDRQVKAVQATYQELMEREVAAYNRRIAGSGIVPLPIGK
jgi:hypothetical protein